MAAVFGRIKLRVIRPALDIWTTRNGGKRFQSTELAVNHVDLLANGVGVVAMQRAPINSLNLDMNQALSKSIDELERDKCRGFILKSNIPSIFSAGVDFNEIYKPDPERFKTYYASIQKLWSQLYGSKMATVALINGNCLAGGCMLALGCDYRIMVNNSKYKIGLSEAKLGLFVPFWLRDAMANTIGIRRAEHALQLGSLFSAEEARQIGLVDQICPDEQSATAAAEAKLKEFAKIPGDCFHRHKMAFREASLSRLRENLEIDSTDFISFTSSPGIQAALGMYRESLKKKKQ